LTKNKFDEIIKPIIDKCIALCDKAIAESKITKEQIAKILLVGGTTLVPAIREALKSYYNIELDTSIDPMTVVIGAAEYPENILDKLSAKVNTTAVDALALATEAGSIKAVNVVLIGVMAKNTNIPYEVWIETIRTTVPPKFLDVNLKAFELGYNVQ
jgi:molecular chaperone DnaK (HSP70)